MGQQGTDGDRRPAVEAFGTHGSPAFGHMAARHTIAQVDHIAELGTLPPEHIGSPGVFVQSIVLSGV